MNPTSRPSAEQLQVYYAGVQETNQRLENHPDVTIEEGQLNMVYENGVGYVITEGTPDGHSANRYRRYP